jgi:D-amino-acid oxidase
VINTPVYISWLQRQVELLGGKVIRNTLSAIPEAVFVVRESLKDNDLYFQAVVNASGMGFGDPDCFPSRGQFLLVSNPCDETVSYQTADGEAVVVIPRPLDGGTLIGGTKEVNNW